MKQIKFLQCFLLSFLLLGFFSCSDEGKSGEQELNGIRELLVGTWLFETDEDYDVYIFNKDGSGVFIEGADSKHDQCDIMYIYNEKANTLTIIEEDGDSEVYNIVLINEKVLVLEIEGESLFYKRM